VSQEICSQVENELRSLIEDSIKFMTHFKREKLTVADIEYALKDRNYYDVSRILNYFHKYISDSFIFVWCLLFWKKNNRKSSDTMSARKLHLKSTLISGLNKMRYMTMHAHKRIFLLFCSWQWLVCYQERDLQSYLDS